jgi:drug/metabolite transporter (DMT)-like permease
MIPTAFDIAETMCSNIALTMLVASVTQMLRATLIIFTAAFSVWILKMKLYKHHYFSLMLIVAGLVLVGLS